MESIYTLGTSSASHTYGNVAAFVREHLLDYFPQNFFTHTHIESKIAWKDIAEILGNGDTEFKKRQYPFLNITPRYNPSADDNFGANTPLTTNLDNAIGGLRRNTLFSCIIDREHHVELAYKMNRDRIEFEVELRLLTLAQQIDVYKNLQNQLVWNRPFTLMAALESMIPKAMIEYLGKMASIDITNSDPDNNQVPLIMRYLNGHAKYPITYKVRNSTSVEEFFMYYRTRLQLCFSDLTLGDGSRKNFVDEYYSLTFRVTAEFNLPGLYALIGNHERKIHGLKFDAIVSTPMEGHTTSEMIPLYTFTNLYDSLEMDLLDGFKFYVSSIVRTDLDKRGQDEFVRMQDVLLPEHMQILASLVRDGVPPETLFRFRLLKNSKELPLSCEPNSALPCEWEVRWSHSDIVIHNSDPLMTYRLLVYANLVQINERAVMMQDKHSKDRDTP